MKAKKSTSVTVGGLDVIEDAVVLLRQVPVSVLVLFYVGALPFIVMLLYFWADMSRGAFADQRLAGSALGLTLLYLWMKCWHAVFCRELLAFAGEETRIRWSPARVLRMGVIQMMVQPWALLARPLALLITVPYSWTRAFFENVSILGDGTTSSVRDVCQEASRQAKLWPGGHFKTLALLLVFGLFVFINTALLIVSAPFLLKTLLGVETVFTSSSYSVLNSTFLVSALAGAWLCINPITKAIHVLRCFRGAALQTGEDLRMDLRRLRQAAALVCCCVGIFAGSLQAAAVRPGEPPMVESAVLDQNISDVLQQREFAWREPRQLAPAEEKGWLAGFLKDLKAHLKSWLQPVKKWFRAFAHWLEDWLRHRHDNEDTPESGFDWGRPIKFLVIVLLVLLVVLLALLWSRFRRPETVQAVETAAPLIADLASDEVTAEQLPEEGWLTLAREMIGKGELRLALRAFYLASLSLLGSRQWVALARHKSNQDYLREMKRRGRSSAAALENFAITLGVFEGAWYGRQVVTNDTLAEAQARLERLRTC